jgi:hypothetical protein
MKTLQEITYYLLGKQIFTHIDSKDYVDWAVQVLENGFDSENIRILAGLDNSDTEERLRYFQKSLDDLNIHIPTDQNEILKDFTTRLANNVIAGLESPKAGLKIMLDIVRASDYSARFMQFMDLDEDIDYVMYSGAPLFNSGLQKDNIDEMIVNEFKLFLQIESSDYNIRELSYCKHCEKVMKAELKRNFSILKANRYNYWCCSICGSKDLIHGSSQEGKIMILKTMK